MPGTANREDESSMAAVDEETAPESAVKVQALRIPNEGDEEEEAVAKKEAEEAGTWSATLTEAREEDEDAAARGEAAGEPWHVFATAVAEAVERQEARELDTHGNARANEDLRIVQTLREWGTPLSAATAARDGM